MKIFACALFLFLSGCAPQSYFKSANDVSKKRVILHLRDKPDMAGILTVPFEDNYNRFPVPEDALKFTPDGKNEEEMIAVKEVTGYSMNKDYYVLKNLFLFTDNKYHLLFAKRLTSMDSRIQLYELYESGKGNATGEIVYSYFISLPGFGPEETLNTKSNKLIPDFDLKMSEFVSDCPSLAEKIRDKETGYFVPFVSFNTYKHRDVMLRIINDYNNCK